MLRHSRSINRLAYGPVNVGRFSRRPKKRAEHCRLRRPVREFSRFDDLDKKMNEFVTDFTLNVKKKDLYKKSILVMTFRNRMKILHLNRLGHANRLNENFLQDIEETLKALDCNENARFAILKSIDSKTFCHGTELKTLRCLKRDGDEVRLENIFMNLSRFAHFMGNYMKPLLVEASGTFKNCGASIFLNRPHVMNDLPTQAYFDEAENNTPIHGGTSFFLSRLPSEIGTFLALIGGGLENDELHTLGIVGKRLDYSDRFKMSSFASKLETSKDFYTIDDMILEESCSEINVKKDNERILRETLDRMRTNDGRKVMLDAYYRKRLTDFVNVSSKGSDDFESERLGAELKYRAFENNNLMFESLIKKDLEAANTPNGGNYGAVYLKKTEILRLFKGEKLEDIYRDLEADGSAFARRCLAVLRSRDQNVLRASLFLIREALNSSFAECLHREYKVLNLLVVNSETIAPDLFEKSVDSSKAHDDLFTGDGVRIGVDMGAEALESRLSNLESDRTLKWQIPFILVKEELSPFKDFYQLFPEPFLCYINELEIRDPAIGKNLKKTVEMTLARYGIDFMHPMFHLQHARKKLFQYFMNSHKGGVQVERMKELLDGDKIMKEYIDSRIEFINDILGEENYTDESWREMQNILLRNSIQRTKYKSLETQNDRFNRLTEFERDHSLDKIRNFMISNRMTYDPKRPLPKPILSLLEVNSDITQLSPLVRKALNLDQLEGLAVRKLDLTLTDLVKYIVGERDPLFQKLKIVDPERFVIGLEGTDANLWMKVDKKKKEKVDPAVVPEKKKNHVLGKANQKILDFAEETRVENYLVKQIYLTDGFLYLKQKYDYLDDLEFPEGIPHQTEEFDKLQKILYYGINQQEKDFRNIFVQSLIESFERKIGPLNRDQKAKIIMEVEEEFFDNYENIQTLKDVLRNLDMNYGLAELYKKRVSVEDLEKAIQSAREFRQEVGVDNFKEEKEMFESLIEDHRKFLEIDFANREREFEEPNSDEKELRLGMELLCQMDENKAKFWNILKAFTVDLPQNSETFQNTIFFRQTLQKLLRLYSTKKLQLSGTNQPIFSSLNLSPNESPDFIPLQNFLTRSAFASIFQFFAPHLFFNLSLWGMNRLTHILNEVKKTIETHDPQHYRATKSEILDQILRTNGVRDESLTISANLELLDSLAFGFADMYQEFRGKLIFAEDVLRKQFEEIGVLERAEARESVRRDRVLGEMKRGDYKGNETESRFEKMMKDMGVFLEAERAESGSDNKIGVKELETLKDFLERNGVSGKYMESVKQFGVNETKGEVEADEKYMQKQKEFAEEYLEPTPETLNIDSNQTIRDLELRLDTLLNNKNQADIPKSEIEALLTLARSIRLENNYSLIENLEKLGQSELPSFDLFRQERAEKKLQRQKLIDKLHAVMGGLNENVEEPKDLEKISKHIDVPIEFLGGRAMSVDPEIIMPQGAKDLITLERLAELKMGGEKDVEENPLAMAILDQDAVNFKKDEPLLESLKTTPIWKIGELAQVGEIDPDLMSLRASDLSAVFRGYLYKNDVQVGSIMSDEAFYNANMRDALADHLLQHDIEQSDLIHYLSHGSTRTIPKKVLLEKYSKTLLKDEQFESFEQDYEVLRKDIQAVRYLALRNRAEMDVNQVDKVIENFERLVTKQKEENQTSNEAELGRDFPLDVHELTEGLAPLDKKKFIKKIQVYRHIRNGSNMRTKQYLLMLRLSQTEQERELCLQGLRREYIRFERHKYLPQNDPKNQPNYAENPDFSLTFPEEKDSLFRLFIDAVARQMEEGLQSVKIEDQGAAALVKQILELDQADKRKELASERFQDLIEKHGGMSMGFEDSEIRGDDSSSNLLASKEVLTDIVKENAGKAVSVKEFIFNLNVAMGGYWNRKKPDGTDFTLNEKLKLIELRRDTYRVLATRTPESQRDYSYLNSLFQNNKNEAHFAELKSLLDKKIPLKKALQKHSVLGPVYQALEKKVVNLENLDRQNEVTELVLDQLKEISSMKFENALEKLEKAGEGGLLSHFYGLDRNESEDQQNLNQEDELDDFDEANTAKDSEQFIISEELSKIESRIQSKLNLNPVETPILKSRIKTALKISKNQSQLNSQDLELASQIDKSFTTRQNIQNCRKILVQIHERIFNKFEWEETRNNNPNEKDLDQLRIFEMLNIYKKCKIKTISINFEKDILGLPVNDEKQKKKLIKKYQKMIEASQRHLSPNQPLKHSAHSAESSATHARDKFVELLEEYQKLPKELKGSQDLVDLSTVNAYSNEIFLSDLENAIFGDVAEDLRIENTEESHGSQVSGLKSWLNLQTEILRSKSKDNKKNQKTYSDLLKKIVNINSLEKKLTITQKRAEKEIQKLSNSKLRENISQLIQKEKITPNQNLLISNQLASESLKGLIKTLTGQIEDLSEKVELFRRYNNEILDEEDKKKLRIMFRKAGRQEMIRATGEKNPLTPEKEYLDKLKSKAKREEELNREQRQVKNILLGNEDMNLPAKIGDKNRGLLELIGGKDLYFRPKIQVENRELYLKEYMKWVDQMGQMGLEVFVPDIDITSMVEEAEVFSANETNYIFDCIKFENPRKNHKAETTGISDSVGDGKIETQEMIKLQKLEEMVESSLERLVSGNTVNIYACLYWLLANQSSIAALDTASDSKEIAKGLLWGIVENSVRQTSLEGEELGRVNAFWENICESHVSDRVSELITTYIELLTDFLSENSLWNDHNLGWNKRLHAMIFSFEAYFKENNDSPEVEKMLDRLKDHLEFDQKQYNILKNSYKTNMLLKKLDHNDKLKTKQDTWLARQFINLTSTNSVIYNGGHAKIRYSLTRDQLTRPEELIKHFKEVSTSFGAHTPLGQYITSTQKEKNEKASAQDLGGELVSEIFKADNWSRFENLIFGKNPKTLLEAQKLQLRDKQIQLREKSFFMTQSVDWAIKNIEGPEDTRNPADLDETERTHSIINNEFKILKAKELGVEDTPDEIYKFRDLYQEEVEKNREAVDDSMFPEKEKIEAIERNLSADMRFDAKTKRLVLETNLKDENLLRKAISFIEDGQKTSKYGKSQWEQAEDEKAKKGEYEEEADVERFHLEPEHEKPGFKAVKDMTLEQIYSSILLKRKLTNFIFEGMKQKRDDDIHLFSFSESQTNFLKFAVENFRGSAVQKILIEEWARNVKETDLKDRESMIKFLNKQVMNHKDDLKKGITDAYSNSHLKSKRRSKDDEEEERFGFHFQLGDRFNEKTPFRGKTHLHDTESLDQATRNAYQTFYDNEMAEEFKRLRELREVGRKMKSIRYNDVNRSLLSKGRDEYGETEGLSADHVSKEMYKIKHPDDGKLVFGSYRYDDKYKGKLHKTQEEELLGFTSGYDRLQERKKNLKQDDQRKESLNFKDHHKKFRIMRKEHYLPDFAKKWLLENEPDLDEKMREEYILMQKMMYGTPDEQFEALKNEIKSGLPDDEELYDPDIEILKNKKYDFKKLFKVPLKMILKRNNIKKKALQNETRETKLEIPDLSEEDHEFEKKIERIVNDIFEREKYLKKGEKPKKISPELIEADESVKKKKKVEDCNPFENMGGVYGDEWDDSLEENLISDWPIVSYKQDPEQAEEQKQINQKMYENSLKKLGLDQLEPGEEKQDLNEKETLDLLRETMDELHLHIDQEFTGLRSWTDEKREYFKTLKKFSFLFRKTFRGLKRKYERKRNNSEEEEEVDGNEDPDLLKEQVLKKAKKYLERIEEQREKFVQKILEFKEGSEKRFCAEEDLKKFDRQVRKQKLKLEYIVKLGPLRRKKDVKNAFSKGMKIDIKRQIRRYFERKMNEEGMEFVKSSTFTRLFAFYLSTFKPKDRCEMLETLGMDPKRTFNFSRTREMRVKMAQISRAMIREGDTVARQVHEDFVFRLSINNEDQFGRLRDEEDREKENDKLVYLCNLLSENLSAEEQFSLLDNIVTEKYLDSLKGEIGRKVIMALDNLPDDEKNILQERIQTFLDAQLKDDYLQIALQRNLNFEEIDEPEKYQIKIIAYLKKAMTERPLDEGEVRMELSRRRLGLDPKMFKGLRPDPDQRHRLRLTKNLELEHFKRDLSPIEQEYVNLFPNDGFGGLTLAYDVKYMSLLVGYNKDREAKGVPIFEMDTLVLDLADLYFEMYGNSPHAMATESELGKFRDEMLKKEAKIFIDNDIKMKIKSDEQNSKIQNVFPLSSLGISKSLISDISQKDPTQITDEELRQKAELMTEEILKQRPELYPSEYGSDPGLKDKRLSIKRQILRRFEDQINERPALDIWKKPVDVDFLHAATYENSQAENLWNPHKRSENLKKQDYQDAREALERKSLEKMLNEMQQDPFFDEKLKEYFSQKHQLKVLDYYEHSMKEVMKRGEPIDRVSDGFVRNELIDFLMKYSDLKLGEEEKIYQGLGSDGANSNDAITRLEERTKLLESEYDKIENSQNKKENYEKLVNFERKFDALKREAIGLRDQDKDNQIFSTPSPHYDIKDLEKRLNNIKDGGEIGGFHQIYYEFNEDSVKIPHALEWLDIRFDPKEWVSRRIEEHVDRVIEARMAMEKYSSQEELAKLDEDLLRGLDLDNIRRAVFRALEQEMAIANELQKNYLKKKDIINQMEIDSQIFPDAQNHFDRKTKDSLAKTRLAAYEKLMTTASRHYLMKFKKEEMDELNWTFEMLFQEAMGESYDYLLHQEDKDKPIRHGYDEYMTKEGHRSGRYVNNHFTARMMGKTVFEESSLSTHYLGAGDTSLGIDGLLRPVVFDNNHFKYDSYMALDDPHEKKTILKGYAKSFSEAESGTAVSKSLGWYFRNLNQKIYDSGF